MNLVSAQMTETRHMGPSPLVQFILRGLKRCYMPGRGLWSYKHHLDGRSEPNEARPDYDVFYSLNVLLGLSKTVAGAREFLSVDPRAMFPGVAAQLAGARPRRYAYSTALWAAAELGVPAPDCVSEPIRAMTSDTRAMASWTAQELGMLLSGTVAQARTDHSWTKLARFAKDLILDQLYTESGLFRDCALGPRRAFGTFATQVYSALSLYHYDELFGDSNAAKAADSCVMRLTTLQGPQGEWPWFFQPASGRVLDFYEVYSVHQHGMAPAILRHAMKRGVPGARHALVKGFYWILGRNELGVTMLVPDFSLIARSQARRELAGARVSRAARASLRYLTRQEARVGLQPHRILITPETRSYELGWTLWSFGDDQEFPELTRNGAFGGSGACCSIAL